MLTSEQIRDRLKNANLSKVSRSSGVAYHIIVRLMNGRNVLSSSLEKLSGYLENDRNPAE